MKQKYNYFKKSVDTWTKEEAIASYVNVYGNDGMKYLVEDLIKAKKSIRPLNATRANELFNSIMVSLYLYQISISKTEFIHFSIFLPLFRTD
ncbi:hypothetical protein BDC45DRAFT_330198 [Circinella umbellata]|nr:hypothetical protein BDC45DRAFT_330198 [Circinella umbellata]